jgi:dimethylhistidine N-methyltransferase
MDQLSAIQSFAEDVRKGLSSSPKFLSSKYFYDAAGDDLFRRIMQLPEYYLTRSEYEIFSTQSEDIIAALEGEDTLQVIELGAGDGLKSQLLLKTLLEQKRSFEYYPIDISAHTLDTLQQNIHETLGNAFPIFPVAAEYMQGLEEISLKGEGKKLILFLGSTIGNFLHEDARIFFREIARFMSPGDYFLVGFDLMKNPKTILDAYNDSAGVTRAFNLNLLYRINRELQANFDVDSFLHYPTYNPINGETRSYLVSLKKQEVFISYLDTAFSFEKDEPVFMEISRKFNPAMIAEYAAFSGLKTVREFRDCKHYFTDMLFMR